MSHIAEDYFEMRSDHNSIMYGLGGLIGSRAEAVKQSKKPKNKWKKDLKAIKRQNIILYCISNNTDSRH